MTKLKRIIKNLKIISLLFFIVCAKMAPPPGGPKDEISPEVVKIVPKVLTPLESNEIFVHFDENIDPVSPAGNIEIYPDLKIKYKVKGKVLKITVKDSLPREPVYIELGERIADLRRNQLGKTIILPFGDSASIPSDKLKGHVDFLKKDISPRRIKVCLLLYDTPDSVKSLNDIVTRKTLIDSLDHQFEFSFLDSNDKYWILVYHDKNANSKFEPDEDYSVYFSQLISEKLTLTSREDSLRCVSYKRVWEDFVEIKLNRSPAGLSMDNEKMFMLDNRIYVVLNDSVSKSDSVALKFELSALRDSITVDTLLIREERDSSESVSKTFKPIYTGPDTLLTKKKIDLVFQSPIDSINKELFYIISDEDTFHVDYDSINSHWIQVDVPGEIKNGTLLLKQKIDTLETIVVRKELTSLSAKELSVISGEWSGTFKPGFTVFLWSLDQNKMFYYPIDSLDRKYKIKWALPGNYRMGYFWDKNNNGILDGGTISKKEIIPSEPNWVFPDPIKLRPFWEVERMNVDFNRLFEADERQK